MTTRRTVSSLGNRWPDEPNAGDDYAARPAVNEIAVSFRLEELHEVNRKLGEARLSVP
jgi:hypothetical protein